MNKIGIISDTHGLLRPEVIQTLEGCDTILHCGDINRQEILERIGEIAPVYMVRGNNDKEWAEEIPAFLDFSLLGLHIFMTHKKKDRPKQTEGYDLVLYGPSHKYGQRKADAMLCRKQWSIHEVGPAYDIEHRQPDGYTGLLQ